MNIRFFKREKEGERESGSRKQRYRFKLRENLIVEEFADRLTINAQRRLNYATDREDLYYHQPNEMS